MRQTEYLIVGAGIIGCWSALLLARQGKQVTVLDTGFACTEASGVNAGTLEILVVPSQLLPLAVEGVEQWDALQKSGDVDVSYKRTGGMYVILKESDKYLLDDQQAAFARNGVKTERLDSNDLRERMPFLSSAVIAANFCSIDGFADSVTAGKRILQKACAMGAEFWPNHEVDTVDDLSNGWHEVRTVSGVFRAHKVLISAGIRSPKLLDPLGVHFPLETRVNQVTVTEKAPPLVPCVLHSPRLSLKQNHEGSVLIGGGWQGYGDLSQNRKDVSIANLSGNIAHAREIVPSLERLNVLRSWSGFEGYSPDRMPLIQEVPRHRGIYAAVTGYCGFTIGPAVARCVTEMMLR